jgi:cytochrome P450
LVYLFKGIIDRLYSPEFRRQHQLVLSILRDIGFGKNIMEKRIHEQVTVLVDSLRDLNGRPQYPLDVVTGCIFRVILGITVGTTFDDASADEFIQVTHQFVQDMAGIVDVNFFPPLRFLPHKRRLLTQLVNMDSRMHQVINDAISASSEDSFVARYISREADAFDREQLVFVVRDLLIAGTETTSTTFLWAILLLAGSERGRQIQEAMRRQIDDAVGDERRLPSLGDRPRLPLVEAFILEVLRFKTLVPLGLMHATSCDTSVGGYFIPSGTMVSIYACQC